MATKCLISYRCEKRFSESGCEKRFSESEKQEGVVYGMAVEKDVLSFLESIKSFEGRGEEYVILNVIPLAEEEAARIEDLGLNTF